MEKILLLTDSASDLTPEDEARTGIRVLNLPVSVEGKEYTDRVDLTPDEMYQILNTCKELPTTAHLNMVDFAEAFQKAAEEGYTDIIYMGLNSHGSATYQSALLGKKLFYEHLPQYADVKIHLLDSLSYSYGYGYPLVLAAARRDQGATAAELVDFIQDFLRHRELYFAMYTLQFAKRSGRIGAAASFVGEMLGLKPVMTFEGGDNITAAKVRGEKNVVPKLFEYYKENHDPGCPNYVLLQGEDPQPARELQALIEQRNEEERKRREEAEKNTANGGGGDVPPVTPGMSDSFQPIWPLPGISYGNITGHFGDMYDNGPHNGLDIGADYGTPIVAAQAGQVISAEYHWSWGNNVLIWHNQDYSTRYAHCSSLAVTPGQYVEQGQTIGYVGNTGYSFGYHLHFEVYYGGSRVNPDPYLGIY